MTPMLRIKLHRPGQILLLTGLLLRPARTN
jgi:hypothetical protein